MGIITFSIGPCLYFQYQSLSDQVELKVPQSIVSEGRRPDDICNSCLIVGSWQPSCSLSWI